MESRSIFRVTSVAVLIALSGILTACGGGDDNKEPTATTVPANAQPTVVATPPPVVPTATATTVTSPPRNTDMSSPRTEEQGTPVTSVPAATPATIVTESATPANQMVEEAATPEAPEAPAGPQTASGTESVGDGTSGAPEAASEAPASPAPSASPMASASPQAGGPVPVVTSCDVQDVPPYTGDVTVYVLTVDLNFRAGPGSDCDMIGDGPLGEFSAVEIIGGPVEREGDESGEWVQVEVGDQVGWLALQYLEPAG